MPKSFEGLTKFKIWIDKIDIWKIANDSVATKDLRAIWFIASFLILGLILYLKVSQNLSKNNKKFCVVGLNTKYLIP